MLKNILTGALLMGGAFAVFAADPYKINVAMTPDDDGAMAYLVNYDTGERLDSVLVEASTATFRGEVDEPFAARILLDGARYGQLIVEQGSIVMPADTRRAFGSPLNDLMRDINDQLGDLRAQYAAAADDAARQAVVDRYEAAFAALTLENSDNPVGYLLFLQQAYEMEPAQLTDYLAAHPRFAGYSRVSKLVEMNARRSATGAGSHYIDFEVGGQKLSDYVGRDGKYLIVDYFASWCRPCREQIAVIKQILAEHPAGALNVLGVAVWDDEADTRRAIDTEGITWTCIIGAGSVPTDIYGISGIPCIMIIAPDGTIVSRDLQGDDLKAKVSELLRAE